MKNLKLYLCPLLLAAGWLLTACESFVNDIQDAKLPKSESRLVISSVIAPHLSHINVIVTESVPLFSKSGATGKRLENAVVRITNGVKEATIPYNAENNLYSLEQSKFPIEPGKTYTLLVSDGKRSVTAQCTVPAKAPQIASYVFDTLVFEEETYKDTAITLRMTWRDIPGDTNQYRVDAVMDIEYSVLIKEASGKFTEKRVAYPFQFNWEWQQGKNALQTDKYQDGALFTSPIGKLDLPEVREREQDGKKITFYPKTKISNVVLEVMNVDQHYYKYQRSLEARNNADNPFAEPATVYTNVKGGFGFFAAYNSAQIKLSKYQ
ncbi:DUF4249 domain-containing protein [Dyadobacter sp. Leaf189]|uniref:DUF4249 domain-containing protein n=1 Tax=Dyadobacter sp. Leaf189 TaxID=1736295 RepID=UPI00070119AB|nr:DUF4249 domain-containing protein [Dyadobacter sp. Leaf189]KQS24683.1 hypothetical protein ASG33_23255 [Dyadobacter sp. Leaf189]